MRLSNEEVGKALALAFEDLPGVTRAIIAILMYRSDPAYFEGLLHQMEENGIDVINWQRQADNLTAMVKEFMANGRIEDLDGRKVEEI